MTSRSRSITGGVDTHSTVHEAAVLDQQGRLLGVATFPVTRPGYEQMLAWMRRFGRVEQVGVEGTSSYGADLTRHLQAAGITVVEVNQPHAHTRNRRGKSDAIDAEAAARKVLSGQCSALPKDTTGIVEAIRQLHVARAGAVQARTAALNQLGDLLTTAPDEIRQTLPAKTLQGKASQAADWLLSEHRLGDPTQATAMALGAIAQRVQNLNEQIRLLERHLAALVKRTAPKTLALLGVGPVNAAELLIATGQNIDRIHGEAAFAHLCGVAPVPASSGKTERHRLNHGGNRAANKALYMITVVRLRYCQRTRDYHTRRTANGKSKQEIIRSLKRYIAREVYYTLRTDLKDLAAAT